MKSHKYKKLFVVLTLLSLAGMNACRPWKHKSPEERAEWIVKRITKELDLNDSQKQTLNRIKDEFIAKHKSDRPQMEAQFAALSELVRADAIDQSKLKDLRRKHQAHRESMENFFVEKATEFHKVLTSEQRAKAAELMQKYFRKFAGEK
ncbi:MAG: Spy/CpxP family protein refolding chaperone [Spirochaetota bacterium]